MRSLHAGCVLLCALAAPADADVEDTLNSRWRGARPRYLTDDCASLLAGSYGSFSGSTPSGKSGEWRQGHEDGQRLVYGLELLLRLPRCFVAAPVFVPG